MKKVLILLLLGVFLSALLIKFAENRNEETLSPIKTTNVKCYSQDGVAVEYIIEYKGENYTEFMVNGVARQITSRDYILNILKNNSTEFLDDSLESRIIPTDSTFSIVSIETIYHLPPEVRELWDEYIKANIEATKAIEKAKNLEILYGK